MALVQAGQRVGIEVRAFGPPKDEVLPGYEGSEDWETRVAAFRPDLLLGDIEWKRLDALRDQLSVPAWLLLRWWSSPQYLADSGPWAIKNWERRISIEPAGDGMPGLTDRIDPIVGAQRFTPDEGQPLRAGYNTWWEADWYGYRDRVSWFTEDSPERQARIDAGGGMRTNGADVLIREAEYRLG